MKRSSRMKMVLAALFAALVFVGTLYLHVTLPYGYFNFGDAFLLLAAWCIGGRYGAAAGAIGAVLADLALGYAAYVPATLVIKAAMALAASGIATAWAKRTPRLKYAGFLLGAVTAALLMAAGYYLFESLLYGFVPALASVPGNLLQGTAAVIVGTLAMTALESAGLFKKLSL